MTCQGINCLVTEPAPAPQHSVECQLQHEAACLGFDLTHVFQDAERWRKFQRVMVALASEFTDEHSEGVYRANVEAQLAVLGSQFHDKHVYTVADVDVIFDQFPEPAEVYAAVEKLKEGE